MWLPRYHGALCGSWGQGLAGVGEAMVRACRHLEEQATCRGSLREGLQRAPRSPAGDLQTAGAESDQTLEIARHKRATQREGEHK